MIKNVIWSENKKLI